MKKPNFRNRQAADFFELCSSDSDCFESGIDNHGEIYFAYLNGIISRETRVQFLRRAKKYYEK